jgi:hypothetical protein
LVITAESWLRLRERRAERKTTQETAGTFVAVSSKWVHRLLGTRGGPRSGSPTMNLVECSGVGFLGIICLDVGMRKIGGLNQRPTVVKNRVSAPDRVDSAPSEREGFGGRLLTHDIGEERRGGGRNGGHFWGIRAERGVDGVRGGTV